MVRQFADVVMRYVQTVSAKRVILAVSGGADSTTLLHVAHASGISAQTPIIVCHVNHGIRHEEADRDEQFVLQLAERYGLICRCLKVDVPKEQRLFGESVETVARNLRYKALEQLADEFERCLIITAHHEQDQVETVLDHLLRGTGVSGLRGMPESRGLGRHLLVRPLLRVSKQSIDEYVKEHHLTYVEDSTNLDITYKRNKIRLELLPYLRKDFNPQIDSALVRLAELARVDDEYMEHVAGDFFADNVTIENNHAKCPVISLIDLPTALQRRVIKLVLGYLASAIQWNFAQIEDVRTLLYTSHGQVTLCRDWIAMVRYGMLHIKRGTDVFQELTSLWPPTMIDWSSFFSIPVLNWSIVSEQAAPPRDFSRSKWESWFARGQSSLWIRPWRVGDRIAPLGMDGSKLVSDLFIDAKVPEAMRRLYPVLVIDDRVVWVPGLCRSQHYLVTGVEQFVQRVVILAREDS